MKKYLLFGGNFFLILTELEFETSIGRSYVM